MSSQRSPDTPLSRHNRVNPTQGEDHKRLKTWRGERPASRDEFRVAVFCALPVEAIAVKRFFDPCWKDDEELYGPIAGDQNHYTTGVVGGHNVVLVHMPGMGKA